MNIDKLQALAVALPAFLRERIERAIQESAHPTHGGMHLGDGKVRVHGADLNYMLRVIDHNSALMSPPSSLLEMARDALETAKNGLQWYRDTYPEAVDDSDDEADEEIDAALAAINEHLKGKP